MRQHDPRPTLDKYAGERGLIAAILRQAVVDAKPHGPSDRRRGGASLSQVDARAFLRDREAVGFWCALLGCDADGVQRALLREAGLLDGSTP